MALNPTLHKNILVQILKDIYTDHSIGPFLGFKGGTAAYLFYDLDRFSIDLDFDLLNLEKEDQVFEQVKKILATYGVLKEARKKRFNLFYVLSYKNKPPEAQNIKIDINRRAFGSQYSVKSFLGISMKVMVQEDMAAHKIMAMYERIGRTNRDIYDVWFLLKNHWPINRKMMEARAPMSIQKFLELSIDALEKMSNRNILSGLGELLNEKQKVWAKAKLKDDTVFLLKLMLENERFSIPKDMDCRRVG